jgi:HSP20 family molecular chaperone IbpA
MATSMTRWEPFAELGDLRNRIDRLFGDLGGTQERGWMPALDVVRENGNLVLRADVPGIEPALSSA